MPRQPSPWFRKGESCWYIKVRGKQYRLCSEAEGHAAAVSKARVLLGQLEAEGRATPQARRADYTVADLCELFMAAKERATKPTTVGWYAGHLASFIDHVGRGTRAAAVLPLHVTGWLDAHPAWGAASRRGAITAVKGCWKWAAEEGHLAADPLAKVRRPRMPRRKVMAADDAPAVVGAIRNDRLREFVEVALAVGMRPGELSALEAAGVDRAARKLTLHGKSGERVAFYPAAVAAIVERLADQHREGPIFLNTKGRPWDRNALRCAFRLIRRRTGIKGAVPYATRHLYGSLAIERGVDSVMVAQQMGHKDTQMLMEHYAAFRDDAMRRAAERAAGGSSGSAPGPAPGPPPRAKGRRRRPG
jgi:integrase